MKVYLVWLSGVIVWNFGFPYVLPLADVSAAVLLSLVSPLLQYLFKLN